MTFEDRVSALTYLGFTPRQTRFLVTVALHSGFCLRRQFAAFAEIEYGKNVRSFLDQLVDRKLARRLQFEINRGHVYHLSARAVYRAIGQEDNRNRRATSPALIARKLMLLDFALAQSGDPWLVTEQDKVAFFTGRLQIAPAHLPRRVYVSQDRRQEPPTRYFVNKLPIFVADDSLHFVFLAADPGIQPFTRFLWDHRGVFARLPRWTVVVVCPQFAVDLQTFRSAFAAFLNGLVKPKAADAIEDVQWYFTMRRAVEQDHLPALSVQLVTRFHSARRRFAGAVFESLYADWLAEGDIALDRFAHAHVAPVGSPGTLLTHELPFTYTQFGKQPGVA